MECADYVQIRENCTGGQQMKAYCLDILGISEVRWAGGGHWHLGVHMSGQLTSVPGKIHKLFKGLII